MNNKNSGLVQETRYQICSDILNSTHLKKFKVICLLLNCIGTAEKTDIKFSKTQIR